MLLTGLNPFKCFWMKKSNIHEIIMEKYKIYVINPYPANVENMVIS